MDIIQIVTLCRGHLEKHLDGGPEYAVDLVVLFFFVSLAHLDRLVESVLG